MQVQNNSNSLRHISNTTNTTPYGSEARSSPPSLQNSNRSDLVHLSFEGLSLGPVILAKPDERPGAPILKPHRLNKWSQMAPDEQYALGLNFFHGEGEAQNHEFAFQCFALAAAARLPAAQFKRDSCWITAWGASATRPRP